MNRSKLVGLSSPTTAKKKKAVDGRKVNLNFFAILNYAISILSFLARSLESARARAVHHCAHVNFDHN